MQAKPFTMPLNTMEATCSVPWLIFPALSRVYTVHFLNAAPRHFGLVGKIQHYDEHQSYHDLQLRSAHQAYITEAEHSQSCQVWLRLAYYSRGKGLW